MATADGTAREPRTRKQQVNIRMSAVDRARLRALARADELDETTIVRQLILAEVRRRFDETPKGPWKALLESV